MVEVVAYNITEKAIWIFSQLLFPEMMASSVIQEKGSKSRASPASPKVLWHPGLFKRVAETRLKSSITKWQFTEYRDCEVKKHPVAVFALSHLNTKGLIFTTIVSTHRHSPPPEGGLQMLSDIWKTNYLSKEQHIKQ